MNRGFGVAWCVIAALAATNMAWTTRSGIVVTGLAGVLLPCIALTGLGRFYGRTGRSANLANLADAAALWIAFSAMAVLSSYLLATLGFPLQDNTLASADAMLGFDWLGWFHSVQAFPAARTILWLAYWSLMAQIVGTLLYLSLTGRFRHQSELLLGTVLAFVITAPLSGLLPAASAWVHFGVEGSVFAYHWADFSSLRAGTMREFRLGDMTGIITFPSFHAALGILLVYAHRCRPGLLAGSAVLNGLLVLSVPSEGGHYLVDAIAGVLIGTLAITAIRALHNVPLPQIRAPGRAGTVADVVSENGVSNSV